MVVPFKASFRGKTYVEWEVAFWQWALSLPVNSTLRHPFSDCESRPISSWQTGIVWFWTAPDSPSMTCDQQRTIIPAGTAIFLSLLGIEASSLEAPPFLAESATEQKQIATSYGSKISNVFCTIDDVKVQNIATYRTTTGQFTFLAPSPWAYGEKGGQGTAVADGYFLLLKPLSPGAHKIHYGGVFHTPVGELPKDITLLITVGANR
ncbi:hypothetical protein FRZ40_30450 [Paraburkholderia azotifigens]|uniref:Uncharacterized protein n=1 Tax=Paraburkholderia azotifigens TaxID=2057004 RepID=A0A5C6VII5_9BURK|nr:hypothetical protein FRZ40_30450 [Paraburkholderia azotifigens]